MVHTQSVVPIDRHICQRPMIDLIRGKMAPAGLDCYYERTTHDDRYGQPGCGPGARYWEPRDDLSAS